MPVLTRKFDSIFSRYRGAVPLNFVRALAYKESRLNPDLAGGSYWGILQVGWGRTGPLKGYNERNGTNYTKYDLFDPDICTRIAMQTINRIVKAYDSWSGRYNIPNLKQDWRNPEYCKLVVAGWNSGYSRAGGVQFVAKKLAERGIRVTHDSVFERAQEVGGTKYLWIQRSKSARKYRWQREMVSLYFNEGGPGPLDAGGLRLAGLEPYLPGLAIAGAAGLVGGVAGTMVDALLVAATLGGVWWAVRDRELLG